MLYLTKSDFKVARTCPSKLYYKKLRYPSLLDDNPYLRFLADGDYMVEKMAKVLFPDGRECSERSDPQKAHDELSAALGGSTDFTWFEPTVVAGPLLARVDIFRREGNTIQIIEVKSSSINTNDCEEGSNPFRGKRGGITSEWAPYLEDVIFQKVVIERAFPDFAVVPYLCLVDKSKAATPNSTFDKFKLDKAELRQNHFMTEVIYTGDVEELRGNHLLALINVSSEAAELQDEIAQAADGFAESLGGETPSRFEPHLCST